MAESTGTTQSVEGPSTFGKGDDGEAKRWLAEIKMYESEVRDWEKRGDKILKRYRNEKYSDNAALNDNSARGFAMLWANTQTLQPTILANPPKANVTRRFRDDDRIARVASEIAERCLDYVIDQHGYYDGLQSVRDDYLLVGQGTQWWRYCPKFSDTRIPLQITDDADSYIADDGRTFTGKVDEEQDDAPTIKQDDDGAYITERELSSEEVIPDYVNWKNFGRSPGARRWSEVYAVWREAFMTRDELEQRFGVDKAKAVSLDHEPPKGNWGDKNEKSFFKKATIYEIWDKSTRTVYWIARSSSLPGFLDKRPDPLKLTSFFPCPRPMLATITTDRFTPVPDFLMYQDQALEMDVLTQRIYALIESIKVKGLYAANITEMKTLLADAADRDMVPVSQSVLAMLNGDLSKSIWMFPIETLVSALNELIAARNVVKQDAYEITGISDIIRGASDPNETLGAQEIKVQSGGVRVRDRQQEMQRFIRDGLEIAYEIIFNLMSDDTIAMMCDIEGIKEAMEPAEPPQPPMMGHNGGPPMAGPMPTQPAVSQQPSGMPASPGMPQPGPAAPIPPVPVQAPMPQGPTVGELAIKLLRDPTKRKFRIDVETDSTIEVDQNAEKQARSEFVTAVGAFIEQAAPVLQATPEFIPMFREMLLFAVRGFKAGEQLESVIEKSMEALEKRAAEAAQQPPPPDPEMVKAQAQAQATQFKSQADVQTAQVKAQGEVQASALDAQGRQAEVQATLQKSADESRARQHQLAVDQQSAATEAQLTQLRTQNEAILAAMDQQRQQFELLIGAQKLKTAEAQAHKAAQPNGADNG